MSDLISRQAAIDALEKGKPLLFIDEDGSMDPFGAGQQNQWYRDGIVIMNLPSAQPERLTDDDMETIRIHLSAYKEKLCNQNRWKEAEEYQRIIDRFMAFASAERVGHWVGIDDEPHDVWECDRCGYVHEGEQYDFCPGCGADMRGEQE